MSSGDGCWIFSNSDIQAENEECGEVFTEGFASFIFLFNVFFQSEGICSFFKLFPEGFIFVTALSFLLFILGKLTAIINLSICNPSPVMMETVH